MYKLWDEVRYIDHGTSEDKWYPKYGEIGKVVAYDTDGSCWRKGSASGKKMWWTRWFDGDDRFILEERLEPASSLPPPVPAANFAELTGFEEV